jgi:predicted DsbA family dithiol-disulfide isomerase
LVNDAPLDPATIGEEIDALRAQVSPELFTGFDRSRFPNSSLPGLALAATAYRHSLAAGERVSLALRTALFEDGLDIADAGVLRRIAAAAGVEPPTESTHDQVLTDWEQGRHRGVVGSPHFFVGGEGFFCPSLDISRVDGEIRVTTHPGTFDALVEPYHQP